MSENHNEIANIVLEIVAWCTDAKKKNQLQQDAIYIQNAITVF